MVTRLVTEGFADESFTVFGAFILTTARSSVQAETPPVQTPAWHVSEDVQAFPSSQADPSGFAGIEQVPVAGLHDPASWHWSAAGHTTEFDPTQAPDWHMSVCVQAFPSLHERVLPGWTHEPFPSHRSSVQGLPSLVQLVPIGSKQLCAPSLHVSSHAEPAEHGLPACPQIPPLHVSTPLQKTPSSQGAVLFVWTQTADGVLGF